MAAALCRKCREPIGYERQFFLDGTKPENCRVLIHATCLYAEIDAGKQEVGAVH